MNIRIILSVTIFLLLLTQIDRKVLGAELSSLDYRLFALAGLAIAAQILFLNIRWHIVLNAGRKKLDFKTNSIINIAGIFANTLFISSIGGIVTKTALSIRYGVSIMHSIFATLLDRFMTFFSLIFLSALSLPFLNNVIDEKIVLTLVFCVMFAFVTVGLFLIALQTGLFKDFILSNQRRARLFASLRNLTENKKNIVLLISSSLMSQCLFVAAVLILAQSFEFEGNIYAFAAMLPVLALIAGLPVSFGGWGVREGAFIYGLGIVGFAKESALLLSIQVGLITLITPLIITAFLIPVSKDFRNIVFKKLKSQKA